MAIVKFIPARKPQSSGGLYGSMEYCKQEHKTWDEVTMRHLVTGINCVASTAYREFMNTKRFYEKTGGRMYYHVVQSFSPEEELTAETAHEIALKLAEQFSGFEVLVCTHTDRDHLHSHLIINSVSAGDGRKYHSDKDNIQRTRMASDELCMQYGLSVVKPKQNRTPGMTAAEYRSADKGENWKLRLAIAIDDAMIVARSRAHFIELMKMEGYLVRWDKDRKYITYTTPEGKRCRDIRLHEAKYLKENMEREFRLRKQILYGPEETGQAGYECRSQSGTRLSGYREELGQRAEFHGWNPGNAVAVSGSDAGSGNAGGIGKDPGPAANDDDNEMDSLSNQMEIGRSYAQRKDYQIIGESFDDNVSGMRFDRRGLNKCTEAVEQGQVDAIIVKDLSRLGRHKTQTALFIDYLRQQGVAVLSVTENLNTLHDEDDLIIGVRGLMNDYYAKDIGNKIRHGYREKQKVGLVITPPFGYWKDRNTNCIYQHPEAAETVRLIYDYYLQGIGQNEIARRLNRLGRKTPAQLRAERYGGEFYASRKDKTGQFVWSYVSVKNVLMEEGYTGVLINHRTETRNGKAEPVPAEHWQRHEDFYPAIITKEEWQQAQSLLKQKARPAFENRAVHRYSGMLTCGNCGQPFVPMIRYWNGSRRIEYVCKGYHRQGKELCSSHRIREECLDAQVVQCAESLRESWKKEQMKLQRLYKQWSLRQPVLDREIARLREEIRQAEEDIDELLMLRIQFNK